MGGTLVDNTQRKIPPVFSFTAFSGTGKTTFIEKLVPLLKQAGLRVGVIKHDAHDFQVDYPGKDTWRFTHAGADRVSIGSKTHFALMVNREMAFEEIVALMADMDIILSEGYRAPGARFIGVFRAASGNKPALPVQDMFAAVTDAPLSAPRLQFPLKDAQPLADYLVQFVRDYHVA